MGAHRRVYESHVCVGVEKAKKYKKIKVKSKVVEHAISRILSWLLFGINIYSAGAKRDHFFFPTPLYDPRRPVI